jgi:epoxyqueuosine reductase
MENTELHQTFAAKMAENGIQYRIMPIGRLEELKDLISHTLEDDITDSDFAEYVSYAYNFQVPEKFPEMQSVIVASKYNPCHTVSFPYNGKAVPVLLPPGYVQFRNKQFNLQKTIAEILSPLEYKCERIILPVKLLAARSGLAKYGRNNISYVPGWGSHHFLGSFITNVPIETDTWQEPEILSECESCSACIENCPTGAIGNDRFLIHGEKCLTFFNRNPGIFPEWLHPEWHNALVGCIRCQDICPANREVSDRAVTLPGFDEAETEILLKTDDFNLLPETLQARFDQFGFPELHGFILRNLRTIIYSRLPI